MRSQKARRAVFVLVLVIVVAVTLLLPWLNRGGFSGTAEGLPRVYAQFHESDSGTYIREYFPDMSLIYTDVVPKSAYTKGGAPFNYYYSPKVNKTFGICSSNRSVFICDGKQESRVTLKDVLEGRCKAAPVVLFRDGRLKIVPKLSPSPQ